MAKVHLDEGDLYFHCPACNGPHKIIVDGSRGWTWNGDEEKPTVSPSIKVEGSKLTEKGLADYQAWLDSGHKDYDITFESEPLCCHSFIVSGDIMYAGDCTHGMAKQTVPLPDVEDKSWIF